MDVKNTDKKNVESDQFDGGYKPSEPRQEPKFIYVPDENGGRLEPNPKKIEEK